MTDPTIRRALNAEFHVDPAARPGWLTGAQRLPGVGEEIFCAAGPGKISAVLGRTGNGSRLLEICLADATAKPFYAAASNVLVAPVPGPPREEILQRDLDGAGSLPTETVHWLG